MGSQQYFPGNIVPFGADEGKDFIFLPILTDQRRGEAQTTFGLDGGGGAKDRCRQHMHFVIDDEAPILFGEDFQIFHRRFLVAPIGQHLVGGDGDGLDLFDRAREFTDLIFSDMGLGQQNTMTPLPPVARPAW